MHVLYVCLSECVGAHTCVSDLPCFALQVIPNYSTLADYDRMFALGVTMYGQMTAGSYCFIGPQGIVHGTTVGVEWMGVGRGGAG